MAPNLDRALARLRTDHGLWASKCARIVDKNKRVVPLELRSWQVEFQAEIAKQRAAEKPIRGIILKARQLGFSTDIQATFIQECTLNAHQAALTVGQDLDTAFKLFQIGHGIYGRLPEDPRLKPALTHERDSKGGTPYMRWANESIYEVETAGDDVGGRGSTPNLLHLSEYAHYAGSLASLLGLLNGVPDTPNSMVFKESTANGRNHFERDWNEAVNGYTNYFAIFVPWWREPEYSLPFDSIEDREAFAASIGRGELGEDEPMLQERFELTLEQLHWRRLTIRTKCKGDVVLFKQEYPAFPEEAFKSTGRHVFSVLFTSRVLGRCEDTDPVDRAPRRERCKVHAVGACPTCGNFHGPAVGILKETGTKPHKTRDGVLEIPTGAIFVPAEATGFNPFTHPMWSIFEFPVPPDLTDDLEPEERPIFRPGQYVIGVDVAGGEEMTSSGETAYHAIQVIDHVTKRQVAVFRSRYDPHLLTREAMLAGLLYNTAIIAVEITGGWGWPVARALNRGYRYPRLYRRKQMGTKKEKQQDRLGFHTDSNTRPEMIALLTEQLSEGTDGILHRLTADELTTFSYDDRGRPGPEPDHFSDLLMARMIAGAVARELPPRPNRRPGSVPSSSEPRF